MIVGRLFQQERLQTVCQELAMLPIQYHTVGFDPQVVEIALKLERKSAYDAVYLALAQHLNAALWTLDGPLYRNAEGQGYAVHLLGDVESV
ncbi:MAG: type II toxin-antitoxin system VapC family toxin, partial [Leptolyngbyaceae cyanobacterium bins.302]|nr:type II toxin-antitoxin system VapC family toxin [Leptolyngbyaceae cyanobacterium bins.302]